MSRGGSFGGGQSSLGYLFGSDEKKETPPPKSMTSSPTPTPPYGIDTPAQKTSEIESPPPSSTISDFIFSHNYNDKSEGQNSGISLTGRPSTKVKSTPGGDSSLGYLFEEDKSP